MEEPQRRVGRVVQAVAVALGKQVRHEAIANAARERAQNAFRFRGASRQQREPFEADHRVSAPIREPVVTGDHRALFVAASAHARRLGRAADRRHDELIRCQHELGRKTVPRAGIGGLDALAAALALGRERRGASHAP